MWTTESKTATHRGKGPLTAGVVNLLLDGQQRMFETGGVVAGNQLVQKALLAALSQPKAKGAVHAPAAAPDALP